MIKIDFTKLDFLVVKTLAKFCLSNCFSVWNPMQKRVCLFLFLSLKWASFSSSAFNYADYTTYGLDQMQIDETTSCPWANIDFCLLANLINQDTKYNLFVLDFMKSQINKFVLYLNSLNVDINLLKSRNPNVKISINIWVIIKLLHKYTNKDLLKIVFQMLQYYV